MKLAPWGIIAAILYVGRNFFKAIFKTLFWLIVFLIFYGLNSLLN